MQVEAKNVYEANDMEIRKPLQVRVGYDKSKSIKTFLEIPAGAHGPSDNEKRHTHVEVYTYRSSRGKCVYCACHGVKVEGNSVVHMLFGTDKFGVNPLHQEDVAGTEKAFLRVHTAGITKLRELHPELFIAPVEASHDDIEGHMMDRAAFTR